jgi:hypothetical protein
MPLSRKNGICATILSNQRGPTWKMNAGFQRVILARKR